MKFDPNIHHRRSIRLKGYDYTLPGVYFVTLVTFRRGEIFGTIVNGEVQLSALGQIAWTEWMKTAQLRPNVKLFEDEFVVMPNHVHGIIWIVDAFGVVGRSGAPPLPDPGSFPVLWAQSFAVINPRSRMPSMARKMYAARSSGKEITTNITSATKPNSKTSGITSTITHENGRMIDCTHPRHQINSTGMA